MSDKAQTARLIASLALNVVSSVGVIFINKGLVFKLAGFHFGTALTIIHFIITFLGCLMFARLQFFELKKLELSKVLSISMAFCGYVVFNNLSLLTNSVSVYQISKIFCTPVIVGVQYFAYNKSLNRETLLSLVPVCFGVFITVYSDANVNWVGTFWAVLAIISNSFYTIWGKTKQEELGVKPLQILTYQAPMSAVMLIFALPAFDKWSELVSFHMTATAFGCIALSCLFAFGVNFSFFLFVGQTSPLTMNVVGYFKTVIVFVGGWLLFDTEATPQNILGIIVTLLGLAMYTKATLPKPVAPEEKEQDSKV